MFEDAWWRKKASDARLDRLELDRLLNHWMMATTRKNVAHNRVASDFRAYINNSPSMNIERVAKRIRYAGTVYKDALEFRDSDPYVKRVLSRILGDMNIVTIMPLILYLKAAQVPTDHYRRCILIIESYLVRRALYGRITQGLTEFFISLLEKMHQERPSHYEETMVRFLNSHTSEALMWPNDRILRTSLTNTRLPGTIARRKMVLVEIERRIREERMAEQLGPTKNLTIEHIMPQQWRDNWPLPTYASIEDAERREDRVHFLGNLTLTTRKLNTSLSNGPWNEKKSTLGKHSTLLINNDLLSGTSGEWNEDAIEKRSEILASRIIDIWKPAQYFIDNPI